MTRGRVDLKIVADRLAMAEAAVDELRALPASDLIVFLSDRRNSWAADALLRRAIEALFDTLRHLLAKAHGLGGLEYRDVARLAADHGLLPAGTLAESMFRWASLRNRLAHCYDEVAPAELFTVVAGQLGLLAALAAALRGSAARLAADDSDTAA